MHSGTWDRERVIERCQEWARQTSAPPTYYDWGSVARARAAGSSSSLARKWEREHPSWPSTAVVYRYLRGWRELLWLAGFPALPMIELPFAERVREALRLRTDGLRWREIGELLGISPDTARHYVYVHDCERCGEPILATGVLRCRRCSSANRSRWGQPFSEREIVAAIRAWRRLEGRAPAQVNWHPTDKGGDPRWERECPRWPPANQVIRRFGSWNAGLQAAGFDRPRPPAVSDEQILEALRAYHRQHAISPTTSEWQRLGLAPNTITISGRFGSWNAALTAAGLAPRRVRTGWSDQEILDGLQRFAADHGRPPRSTDRVGSLSEYPSPALAVTRFGSWSAALGKAGLEPGNRPPVTDREIVRVLRGYQREHRRSPTTTAWKRAAMRPHAETIIRHCGSWAQALALAGIKPAERVPRGPSREEIVSALRAYACAHGKPPSSTAWRNARLTPGVKAIYRRFGSWPAALKAAGLRSPASIRQAAPHGWRKTEIIAVLRADAKHTGRAPQRADWSRTTAEHPSAQQVAAIFGSWRQALAAAGIAPNPVPGRWSAEAIIDRLRADLAANGTPPRASDWKHSINDRPTPGTVARIFGSWNAALQAAELPVDHRYGCWTKEGILEALRRLEQELGRPPTSPELNTAPGPGYPTAKAVARAFGSWRAAARQLSWPQPPRRNSSALRVALREAICEFDQLPTRAQWQQLAAERDWPTAHALVRQHGSWGAVRVAATKLSKPR
ncbi:MAG: sigma-70 region 4 domain-containing protein [Actinomycetota bacterium]|nr:sigma-70 region 4 domain-containing protein [Actinomycetota bacterium]